jgi:hypothetical protein
MHQLRTRLTGLMPLRLKADVRRAAVGEIVVVIVEVANVGLDDQLGPSEPAPSLTKKSSAFAA